MFKKDLKDDLLNVLNQIQKNLKKQRSLEYLEDIQKNYEEQDICTFVKELKVFNLQYVSNLKQTLNEYWCEAKTLDKIEINSKIMG